jgi:hypothetical protein
MAPDDDAERTAMNPRDRLKISFLFLNPFVTLPTQKMIVLISLLTEKIPVKFVAVLLISKTRHATTEGCTQRLMILPVLGLHSILKNDNELR